MIIITNRITVKKVTPFILCLAFLFPIFVLAQTDKQIRDSLFINETERDSGPAKVLHAEPLYIDLIRDLGARKGERVERWDGVGR